MPPLLTVALTAVTPDDTSRKSPLLSVMPLLVTPEVTLWSRHGHLPPVSVAISFLPGRTAPCNSREPARLGGTLSRH